MPRYDKLVRDRVPERLTARGVKHEVRVLDEDEYVDALRAKLREEVAEYESASVPEDRVAELADVLEVVYALALLAGLARDGLEDLRSVKANRNGRFERRLLLTEVLDGRESIMFVGLDHVQLPMPAGEEDAARRFYVGVLGLTEITKPPGLRGRGGCWFVGPSTHLHLGVDSDFRPAGKAHPALLVANLDAARQTLAAAGIDVLDDDSINVRRFYASDPFGNRLEFVAASDRGFSDRPSTA